MKKTSIFVSLLFATISTCTFGINGDMGLGTEPLTDGSETYPYLIEDLADFDTFANTINAATYWAAGVHTKLMTDIDLSGRTYQTAVIAPDTSTVQGYQGTQFSGFFDGNEHIISILVINGNDYVGLFGVIENYGSVERLGLNDVNICSTGVYIGGLCGNNRGTLKDCYASGIVSGEKYVGGLCGTNVYSITNSYATTEVDGISSIGGLCGNNQRFITNSYAISNVRGALFIGGLCGINGANTSIQNCFFYCFGGPDNGYGTALDDLQLLDRTSYAGFDFSDNSEDGTDDNWAIIEGYCPKLSWQTDNGPVAPNALDSIITTLSGTGYPNDPFVISNYAELLEFRTNSALRIGHYVLTEDIELDSQTYTTAFVPTYFNGYFDGGSHVIRNLNINGEEALGFFCTLYGDVVNLGIEDVNVIGTSYIGGFCGDNFSGNLTNCHVIGSVNGTGNYIGGLCGRNLDNNLVNCYVVGTINGAGDSIGGLIGSNDYGNLINCYTNSEVSGDWDVGGLCGENGGNLTDCYATGTVNGTGNNIGGLSGISSDVIMNCYATNIVNGLGDNTGGLCGRNYGGTLTNCYATGAVNGTEDVGGLCGVASGDIIRSYATGNVSGAEKVGGLCGSIYYDNALNCYAMGAINAIGNYVGGLCGYNYRGNLQSCYSTGNVSGNNPISGLCGYNYSGSVWKCYFLESAGPDNGAEMPLDDPNMMIQANFVGWDFVNDWMMLREGEDYPRLAWQTVFDGDIAGLYGADMVDFAYLANYWGLTGCSSGTDCGRADIDDSGDVGLGDLVYVAQDWLK